MQTIKKYLFLLTPRERKDAGLLLSMILIIALLDMIGVASILPFVAVLTNPGLVETNFILKAMFQKASFFGVEDTQQFLFVLGFLVFFLLIITLIFKAITTYVQVRFVHMRQYSIGKRLVEGYLHQPYTWFLNHHSSDLGKTILTEIHNVIGGGLSALLELIAKSMVTIALIILLIINDPKLALIIGISLSSSYLLIFYFSRNYLKRIGKKRLESNELRFMVVNEAFSAAKEIKVGGLEQTYIDSFSNSAQNFARTISAASVISLLPRFFLEAVAFGGILLIILSMMGESGDLNTALPILSLYIFASYRLMPALQAIYRSFSSLTFISPSLDKLHDDIKNLKPIEKNQDQGILSFNKKINLKNIHYNYPNTSRASLKNINLNIPANSTIGFIGATGSGKTTIVDIILGLLNPKSGTLEVDGQIITKQNSRAWQRSIGYVPQEIFLADDTLAANIAFGVDPGDINKEAVEKASKIANLHEFVMDELPKQYQTTIGERGIRLSGGERQRVGIARALYHNPKVLVLDEATSALDNQTEQAVMEAVNNLGKSITIILIAHRLSTVKRCDKIFLLEKGELKNQGTFDELVNNSDTL
jgi:ATP-binding cassette, subfamily B, bacterial PglK